MSTFLELCGDLADSIGYNSPPSVVGQSGEAAEIVRRIAQADLEIQNIWQDWSFLSSESSTPYVQATVSGTKAYTKPSDMGAWDMTSFVLDYTLDTYQTLDPLDYDEWRRNYRNGVQTSDMPTKVVQDRNKDLILWPTPDAAYSLTGEYGILPVKMDANTTVSPIPVQFHRIIVLKAKIFYAEEDDAPEVYEAANAEYAEMLDQLEAYALPDQARRRQSRGEPLVVRAV